MTRSKTIWMIALCAPLVFSSVLPRPVLADPKLIEAAKKEGELFWWSTIAQDQSQKVIDEFMKLLKRLTKSSIFSRGDVLAHL